MRKATNEEAVALADMLNGLAVDGMQADMLVAAIKDAYNRFQTIQKRQFTVGSRVKFYGRDGGEVSGTVIKINRKNVKVLADGTTAQWTVSPSLLRAA